MELEEGRNSSYNTLTRWRSYYKFRLLQSWKRMKLSIESRNVFVLVYKWV